MFHHNTQYIILKWCTSERIAHISPTLFPNVRKNVIMLNFDYSLFEEVIECESGTVEV